jgi:hypothetical protein
MKFATGAALPLLLLSTLSLSIAQGGLKQVPVAQPDVKRSFLSSKETTLDDLLKQFPMASPTTVQRFYDIYGGRESLRLIMDYYEWKNGHQLPAVPDDAERWDLAVQQSFVYLTAPANVRKNKTKPITLPKQQVIYDLQRTDHKGYHVFYILPMRMDLDLDDATEMYADILAGYLESFLADKPAMAQVTLLADLRSGRGWPDPPITVRWHGQQTVGGDHDRTLLCTSSSWNLSPPILLLLIERHRKRYRPSNRLRNG